MHAATRCCAPDMQLFVRCAYIPVYYLYYLCSESHTPALTCIARYHLDVPVRLKETMEQAIARSEAAAASPGENGSCLEFLPVQPTRAAMRYKTNEILSLEQEVGHAALCEQI